MLAELRALAGEDAVREGDPRWAVCGRTPRAVVAPASEEAAAAVLARASVEGWAVECAGAGTWLDAGRPPERLDVVLTTERLGGVHEYEPADLTAGVGAGARVTDLQARLREHRQWLPLDPAAAPPATLGAVLATAAAGPLRLGHGTPRDHALGLTLVTGDGRVLRLGGRVVKNVAGYDLVRLAVGSRGTLGLITRAHVRLRALPERDSSILLALPEPTGAAELAVELRQAPGLAALELFSPALSRRVLPQQPTCWKLLARLQGGGETVEAGLRWLEARAAAGGLRLDEAESADAWARLAAVEAAADLEARLADRPAELTRTLAQALEAAGSGEPLLAAHAGSGIVRLLADEPGAADAGMVDRLSRARSELEARRGTLLLGRAPRALRERLDPWGDAGDAVALMQGLRKEFDPAGILSPGRFVVRG